MFTDFQYDDKLASDFGLTVVTFDSSSGGSETVSTGSNLTFNSIQAAGQDEFENFGATYSEAYSCNFQLCKIDNCTPAIITPEEYGEINRSQSTSLAELKVTLCDALLLLLESNENNYENIRYFGSFNIQAIKIRNEIYGIDCTFTSNAPYAFSDEIVYYFSGKSFNIYDDSDEIGEIYPYIEITCNTSGNLTISNSLDDEILEILNCSENETIIIDNKHKIIRSNNESHNITDDFNYNYLKIINTYENRQNDYTSSLDVNMIIKFSSRKKVGI